MIPADLTRTMLELPVEERLKPARQLVENVVSPAKLNEAITEGMRRIEEIASGRVTPLSEEQFRAALR